MQTITIAPEKSMVDHRMVFLICVICYLCCGLVSTLMSVYLPVVVRDLLGNVTERQMGEVGAYIGSMYLYGWTLGGISFGLLGDRVGRVKSFIAAVILYAVFTSITGLTSHWMVLVAYRFIAGFGVGGVLVLSTILVAETWPQKSRSIAIGVLAVMFPVGIVCTGLVNNSIPEWRNAFLVGIIPLCTALAALFLLKESAQWKNRHPAQKEMQSSFQLLNQPLHRKNLFVGAIIFGAMLIGLWAIFSWLPTWVQSLFTNPSLGQKERGITMMLLGGGGIVGGAFSGFLSNRLGYKKTLLITFAGSFVMCFILFSTNVLFTPLVYLETALLALFFGISQGTLSAYLPELFPVRIRGTATGFCFNIGRVATATVVFFVGTLVTLFGGYGNAVLAFSLTFLIGFIFTFFAKEVKPTT
jgi:MFS family permease